MCIKTPLFLSIRLPPNNYRDIYYCTCSTAAGTAAKVITTDNDFILRKGIVIGVKFSATNTASNCTLNVNNSGAKQIYYNNTNEDKKGINPIEILDLNDDLEPCNECLTNPVNENSKKPINFEEK